MAQEVKRINPKTKQRETRIIGDCYLPAYLKEGWELVGVQTSVAPSLKQQEEPNPSLGDPSIVKDAVDKANGGEGGEGE